MFRNKSSTGLKITVWMIAGLALLLMLPAGVGVVWAPSCSGCHSLQAEKLDAGIHSQNTCISCHATEGRLGEVGYNIRVWYTMVLQVVPGQDSTRAVQDRSCMQCHGGTGVAADITSGPVTNRGLMVNHDECTANLS